MKRWINRMDPEADERRGGDDLDHLISDDRAALLKGYRSPEKGKKRTAALLAVVGSETARGATGLLTSGLSGTTGVWIATTLLGLAGVGLVVSQGDRREGREPGPAPTQTVEGRQKPAEPVSPTVLPPADIEPVVPQLQREEGRSAADRASSAPEGSGPKVEPAQTEPQEPGVDRHEEVRTRVTIELPDQQPK